MTARVTTFKDSGKWYDEFDVTIPDDVKPFEVIYIKEHIEKTAPQCKEFNYVYKIEDPANWQWQMIINTRKPSIVNY